MYNDDSESLFLKHCVERNTKIVVPGNTTNIDSGEIGIKFLSAARKPLDIIVDTTEKEKFYEEQFREETAKLINAETNVSFFNKNPYIRESITHMWMDFQRCYVMLNNPVWKSDLGIQYAAVLSAIATIIKDIESDSEYSHNYAYKQVLKVNEIIQAMQQTFDHLSQGDRLFFDAPGSCLPYSGSFRSIIWTYKSVNMSSYYRSA